MNRDIFEAGYDPADYIRGIRNYRSFVKELASQITVEQAWVDDFRHAVDQFPGPVRATFMTEDWCGDAACNLPVLAEITRHAGVELRVIRGSEQNELKNFYESQGIDHIPVFSLWDSEFAELVRWVEAPASIDEKKSAWKAKHPHFMELFEKQKADNEAAKQFAKLYREFLVEMAEWYREGGWKEVCVEVTQSLRNG